MAGGIIVGWKEGWRVKCTKEISISSTGGRLVGGLKKVMHAVGSSNEAATYVEKQFD